jgi:hypothetical protein
MKGATAREDCSNSAVPAAAKDVGKDSDIKGSDTKGKAAKGPAPPLALAKLPPPLALAKLTVRGEKVAKSARLGKQVPSNGGNKKQGRSRRRRQGRTDGGKEAPGGHAPTATTIAPAAKRVTAPQGPPPSAAAAKPGKDNTNKGRSTAAGAAAPKFDEFQVGLSLFTANLPPAQAPAAAKRVTAPQSPPPPAAAAKPKDNKNKDVPHGEGNILLPWNASEARFQVFRGSRRSRDCGPPALPW